ncbi:hypothetical protein PLICRDRAFT_41723 [Plicaturopsis crispa FD-325 SS-3]|nr:hypothetical protein PLICRDRAFT_41723 [Plicaturopsis crispa FD-325 SS-3]
MTLAPLSFVTADLNFYDDRTVNPTEYRWTPDNQAARPPNTHAPDTHKVQIYDMRSLRVDERQELGLTVMKAGFEALQGWGEEGDAVAKDWNERKWEDEAWVTSTYYPYVEKVLRAKYGATKVVVFDHTLRKRTVTDSSKLHGDSGETAPAAEQTHIDQTYWAAIERVRMHLGPAAAQRVLAGSARAVICNLWRPLVGPVSDHPLAYADARSVDEDRDLAQTLPAPPGCRTGESQMVRFHPAQRWYYLSAMDTDECMLLQCFDSGTGVRAPHSAFADPNTRDDAQPRWSMEVRTVILIEGPGKSLL